MDRTLDELEHAPPGRADHAVSRQLGYLSGAPRVSTHPASDVNGARSHVLGIVGAFRDLGWEVRPYIVGDRVTPRIATGSHRTLTSAKGWALLADLGRLTLRAVNGQRAWRELGSDIDWVYERFGAFQALGQNFQRHGIPWILETQAPFYEEAKLERKSLVLSGLARRLELAAYRQCDVLICVSHALRDLLMREAHLPARKVLVVPNGVDPKIFDPDRGSPLRSFEGFTICYAGSLTPWQGLDLLLHAMHGLQASGVQMHLVVIGEGIMRANWEVLARDLGLAAHARFLGRVPQAQVPGMISGCDIGFTGHIPSRHGSVYHSPLKLYEYLAMRKPVVASASEDALAVIRENENGFMYQAGDLSGLVRALKRAWTVRESLGAMGSIARDEILAHHTWKHRVELICRGVEAILEKPDA